MLLVDSAAGVKGEKEREKRNEETKSLMQRDEQGRGEIVEFAGMKSRPERATQNCKRINPKRNGLLRGKKIKARKMM